MNAAALRRRVPWPAVVTVAVLVLLAWLAAAQVGFRLGALFGPKGAEAFARLKARLWPPSLESDVVSNVLSGVAGTLAISVAGTFLASLMGFLLMPFCCRLFWREDLGDEARRSAFRRRIEAVGHHGFRLLANTLRTVPFLVWGILFVYMVGIGALPGVLAIGLHTAGVLARLYAQAIDTLDRSPLQALRAAGASRAQVFWYGVVPAVRPAFVSYTFYRWEVNIREAAVLGFVGAGGLGAHIKYSLGTFRWSALSSYVVAVIVLVLCVDAVSAYLRKRLV